MMGKGGTSRQCSKPASLAPTSTRDMSVESESYFMIGSRDLEQRLRFESACRSLTSAGTFFHLNKSSVKADQRGREPSGFCTPGNSAVCASCRCSKEGSTSEWSAIQKLGGHTGGTDSGKRHLNLVSNAARLTDSQPSECGSRLGISGTPAGAATPQEVATAAGAGDVKLTKRTRASAKDVTQPTSALKIPIPRANPAQRCGAGCAEDSKPTVRECCARFSY